MYLLNIYSIFKVQRHSFCPSIGRQRESSFFNPLSEKISKDFFEHEKAADFIVKSAA